MIVETVKKLRAALHFLFSSRYVLGLEAENSRLREENRGLWNACSGNRVLLPAMNRSAAPGGLPAEPGQAAAGAAPTKRAPIAPVGRRSWHQIQSEAERVDRVKAAKMSADQLDRDRAALLEQVRREKEKQQGVPAPQEMRAPDEAEPLVEPETAEETIQ